ncbi:sugar transferase [Streptococcus halotolerans]|uniref:sugar transferase n=1 Tax=Streptococcus halotolerans TaxID=1814128 RepID=UPI000A6FFE86|nr:sugar transferase [Streptococcus halotolerans]
MYSEASVQKMLFLLSDFISLCLSCLVLSLFFEYPYLDSYIDIIFLALSTVFLTVISNNYSLIHKVTVKEFFWLSVKFIWKFLISILVIQFLKEIILGSSVISLNSDALFIQFIVVFFSCFIFRIVTLLCCSYFLKFKKNVILVAPNSSVENYVKKLMSYNYDVKAVFNQEKENREGLYRLKSLEDIRNFLSHQEINEVIISAESKQDYLPVQKYFHSIGLPVSMALDSSEITQRKYAITRIGKRFFITSALNVISYRKLLVKRGIDIIIASLGTIIMGLVFVVIYPIVQKQSKGPMLFKQKRIGKNGKIFNVYKFRSMYLDAEERKKELMSQNQLSSDLMFKMDNDPRIFPFGQKMRDWSIDELPQFINVLKGDMSVIGTRPPTLNEYYKYELHHFKRLAMKPGITGMWQVSGRSNITDFEKVVELDTYYIENWSVWLDVKIFLKTIIVVLKRDGSK